MFTKLPVSPPPIKDIAPSFVLFNTASKTALLPLLYLSTSNKPKGPFHAIKFDLDTTS